MKNFKDFIRVYLPLIVGIIVTGISLVILQAYMGMKPQVYKDVILEAVALTGVNKTGEVYSVWISIFLGIISILVYLFLKKENIKKLKNIKIQNFDFLGIGVFLIPIISILILKPILCVMSRKKAALRIRSAFAGFLMPVRRLPQSR